MKLLVAHPDPSEQLSWVAAFSKEGHAVDAADTGFRALELARAGRYDLLVLHFGLPDVSLIRACGMLRCAAACTPILAVAAARAPDIVAALDAGADNCIVHPFGVVELLAHARALLRRQSR